MGDQPAMADQPTIADQPTVAVPARTRRRGEVRGTLDLMHRPLQPRSEAGRSAVAQAEAIASAWRPGAQERDDIAELPVAEIGELRRSGFAAVCVDPDLGGLGLRSLFDIMAVAERLAQGDSSLTLATIMHIQFSWNLGRIASGGPASARRPAQELLTSLGAGDVWFTAAVTEPGTNYFHPRTTLDQHDGGWRLNGTKAFATGSAAATHLVANTVMGDDGRLATVVVPATAPGVSVLDDWDGMGMRASGSGRVVFDNVQLDADVVVVPGSPAGAFSAPTLVGRALSNVGNLAAMVGVAEEAVSIAHRRVTGEGRITSDPLGGRATVRQSYAELVVELTTALALLERLGDEADRVALEAPDLVEGQRFMAEFQATKILVNRLSVSIVDRAMNLVGGAGYGQSHPLSRLYRDVRAGAFMQPFTPHEALGYIGSVAVGHEPDPHH